MRRLALVTGVALAGGLFALGRLTSGDERDAGRKTGYAAGLREGRAAGVQEGRALQQSAAAPAGSRRAVRAAFDTGYAAGANDVFGGYDGGWRLATPYVITLRRGTGPIAYRIASRARDGR